jgi:hypothetical protein
MNCWQVAHSGSTQSTLFDAIAFLKIFKKRKSDNQTLIHCGGFSFFQEAIVQ